jgi:hypothetical protein
MSARITQAYYIPQLASRTSLGSLGPAAVDLLRDLILHQQVLKLVLCCLQVYGISADKPAAQAKWREKEGISFNLLCDPAKEVRATHTHIHNINISNSLLMHSEQQIRVNPLTLVYPRQQHQQQRYTPAVSPVPLHWVSS